VTSRIEATVQLIPVDDQARWTAALEGLPIAPAHTHGYNLALSKSDPAGSILFVVEHGSRRLVIPLVERSWHGTMDVATPYGIGGPIAAGEVADLHVEWRKFATNRGWVSAYLSLHPLLESGLHLNEHEISSLNSIYLLDLREGWQTLRTRLSDNIRERVREWSKSGAELVDDGPEVRSAFVDLYPETMSRVGASNTYRFSRETMMALLSLPGTLVVGARRNNAIEAVSAFCATEFIADYSFNASTDEGRQHSAAIILRAVELLVDRGIPFLNLGGGAREGDGLAQFKRRFGGARYPLHSLKQIFDPARYEDLCQKVGVIPGALHPYFPAYRAHSKNN
jgi:hypothetical protein